MIEYLKMRLDTLTKELHVLEDKKKIFLAGLLTDARHLETAADVQRRINEVKLKQGLLREADKLATKSSREDAA